MSSMIKKSTFTLLASVAFILPANAYAQEAQEWDQARANLVASYPSGITQEISRWERLYADRQARISFREYASFLLANPDFPDEITLRGRAETRLRNEFVPADELLAFFSVHEPATNFAKAHYALVLYGSNEIESRRWALESWRGGEMSATAEATILANFGQIITQPDQNARMDALLWQRDREGAERQIARVSPERREVFAARLSILQGGSGASSNPTAASDPGYLYNRSRKLRQQGRTGQAIRMIADGPALTSLPFDQTAWVTETLRLAKAAGSTDTVKIAAKMDEAFAPGADISQLGFRLRDDYTTLMWAGGTNALWRQGNGSAAAPLFYRYGAAARTPQTRSKGFFWAGEAASRAGDQGAATRYYEMAAEYPSRFYGQLAIERMGRALPSLADSPNVEINPQARAEFNAQPLTQAVAEVAKDTPWATGVRFYRAMAAQAQTVEDYAIVAEFAREIGRRDLAVILSSGAQADGLDGFTQIGHPRLDNPAGTNWTMIHAVARQESQFAENAISHAGARGLMQFMPATARMEARAAGVPFSTNRLIDDPTYSMRLGSNHIERLIRQYNGSYPLAIAAYNAGPGNVNKWLRQNGDPRRPGVDWLEWIEKIPFFETKNYVQRVIENAVVYENLYPEEASYVRPRGVSDFLR